MTVEEAVEADRRYFAEHPDQDEYIREFCPGEFGAAELPDIPAGFRYATVVTVIHRTDGVVDGRHRRMIAVCDDLDAETGRAAIVWRRCDRRGRAVRAGESTPGLHDPPQIL